MLIGDVKLPRGRQPHRTNELPAGRVEDASGRAVTGIQRPPSADERGQEQELGSHIDIALSVARYRQAARCTMHSERCWNERWSVDARELFAVESSVRCVQIDFRWPDRTPNNDGRRGRLPGLSLTMTRIVHVPSLVRGAGVSEGYSMLAMSLAV